MQKRILYISNYRDSMGGISGQVDLLARYVGKEPNYTTTIFSTKASPIQRIFLFFKLIWVARKYDILHAHACSDWGMLPAVFGICAGRLWNRHVIVTYHGGGAEEYFKRHPRFVRRWLTRADCVIVLSGFLEHIFQQYSIPCVVIPNMIELKEIKRTSVFNPQAPSFISVRSLDETYNIPCILRAFKIVQQEISGATLTVLGSGPLKDELIRYVEDNKIQHVQFVGQVVNKDIYSYLADHDVLLSAPKIDNMPLSLLEAMNAKTLVISSNVGGVPYMIKDGKTGLLYDYDDDKALAKHMIWATKNIEKVQEITSAAHQEVQRYCWANVRKLLLPLYD